MAETADGDAGTEIDVVFSLEVPDHCTPAALQHHRFGGVGRKVDFVRQFLQFFHLFLHFILLLVYIPGLGFVLCFLHPFLNRSLETEQTITVGHAELHEGCFTDRDTNEPGKHPVKTHEGGAHHHVVVDGVFRQAAQFFGNQFLNSWNLVFKQHGSRGGNGFREIASVHCVPGWDDQHTSWQ